MSSMVAVSKIIVAGNVRTIPGVEDLKDAPLSEFPLDEKATILALAENIKQYGLLQPIVVKDLGKGKGFRLIDGYRRFKAVQHLGARSVDVKSVKGKTEDEAVLKLVANIHRVGLNPLDIARGLEQIQQIKGIKQQKVLAKAVDMSEAWVSQHLVLLKSDSSVQKAVKEGEMGLTAARAISSLPKGEQAAALKSAKKEAKRSGKEKVTTKGARRQAQTRKKKAAGKQLSLQPVVEREAEQKVALVKEFLDEKYGDKKRPASAEKIALQFWDFLFERNRVSILPS